MDTLLKTSIFNRVQEFCSREKLISPGQTIIIGLSGGPDSVFLLYFFLHIQKKYNLNLITAHLDHGWRPESAQDAQFCKEFAEHANITYVNAHLRDLSPVKASGSLEQDARKTRRLFFEHVAQEHHANAIALAHHQDDQIETFFIRLIRGSGLTGLTSIKPRHGFYIRPLLSITKKEILEFLDSENIRYCIDSTNQDTNYLRNNIRHTLMPVYNALDTRAIDSLTRTIEQLQSAENFIENSAQEHHKKLVIDGWLDLDNFLILDAVMQHRILLMWIIAAGVPFTPTEKFFAEITRFFVQQGSKTHAVSNAWAIQKIKRKAHIIVLEKINTKR